jgi:hypothetical protein
VQPDIPNLHELDPFLDLAGRGTTLLAGWS